MNEANWPIRIGGEYKAQTSGLFRRVIAIDGDAIHHELVYASDGDVLDRNSYSSHLFRRTSHPEDQSPIPALVAALRKIQLDLENIPGSPRTDYEAQALETAREALAKAEACGYTLTKISGASKSGKASALDALDFALINHVKGQLNDSE